MTRLVTLVLALFLVVSSSTGGTVISPTGAAYSSVSANSEFSPTYAAQNLFTHNVTGLALGAQVEGGPGVDWAIVGVGPGYVVFQLDQVYSVGSIFYAQRIGAGANADKVDQISIWASSATPFSPANPGSLPLTVVTITNKQSGIWCEYALPTQITGRYFLVKIEQNSGAGGNIGGNELRLGASPLDTTPPSVIFLYPDSGATVKSLNLVEVNFSEPVGGVDAGDVLVNGQPATNLAVITPSQYVFSFPQPATGVVQLAWAPGNDIRDLSSNSNGFPGGSWSYTLDPDAPIADVMISEFMASNGGKQINSVHDELGNSPDWIELYNSSVSAVSLTGWFLTDDATKPTKWTFPSAIIPGNSYLLVFASGRDTNVAGQLHTSFKLGAGGGYLGLLDSATNVVSAFAPAYPPQFTDVSFGRDRLDPTLTGYFTNATPGAPNAIRGAGFAPDVRFSRVSGAFVTAFNLNLWTPDTNSEIRYVFLTNNVPSGATAITNIPTTNSMLYTGPILIDQTVQIRTRAFPKHLGYFPGPPRTESYVRLTPQAAAFTSDLPIVLLHNLKGGTVPSSIDQNAIVMIFEPANGYSSMTNPPTLVSRSGINIRGRGTGGFPKSSFAVEIWDEYNQDQNVEFCGLPDESDWVLYAPNSHDVPLIHNPLMHQLSRDIGRYSSRTRFAEVFLNTSGGSVTYSPPAGGNYNGIYVIEEKIKRGDNRVNVEKLEPQMTNTPDITGGYMFKFDSPDPDEQTFLAGGINPGPDGGAVEIYQYPKGDEMVSPLRAAQRNYLLNYLNSFYTALYGANWTNPATGYAQFFDVDAGIDHHLLNVLAINADAFRLSGYIHIPRAGKITMGPLWDLDISLGASKSGDTRPFDARSWRGIDYDFSTDFFNASQYYNNAWYHRLFSDPDFWQRYIDRYQELRADLWSTNHLFAVVDSLADQLRGAQPREVVRWLGSGPSDTSPRTGVVSAYDYSYNFGSVGSYQGEIDFLKQWLTDRVNFMDTNFLSRPMLGAAGGYITNGFTLSIVGPSEAGSIVYYTLDGTDPRSPGGAINGNAHLYASPIVLSNNARVMARAYNPGHRNLTGANNPPISSPWSGLAADTYITVLPPLVVTEIMYHPPPPPPGNTNDANNYEFIELKNTGTQVLNLVGIRFTNGISFTFTSTNTITNLGPGQYLVLVKNMAAFAARYPAVTNIAGVYAGSLDNSGERLYLEGALKEPILDFSYDDSWYPTTDGQGFSLVIRDENGPPAAWNTAAGWQAGSMLNGSPGQADGSALVIAPIVINEALTHSDPPASDSIELFNPTAVPVNIGGWFLSDDHGKPAKYTIPANTFIPAGGFVTFNESQFNAGGSNSFALSSLGEEVYLFSGDGTNLTGYRHGFTFGAQLNGVTFGRYLTSIGEEHFIAQTHNTLGGLNSRPLVGPVVINEIMFNPSPYGVNNNSSDEFIELRNISPQPTALFDAAHPTNTWLLNGGAQFTFPPGVVLPPLSHILVVNFDPDQDPVRLAWFRNLYLVPSGTLIYGPYTGNLNNAGDTIALYKPDQPQPPPGFDAGFVPYVLVDEVHFAPSAPWPTGANGTGNSLQRIASIDYGNDPINWLVSSPTAGSLNAGALSADTDHDGLPDEWELANGLDPTDPNGVNGPSGDLDADGMSNLQEFLAGTNPNDSGSRLRIESVNVSGNVLFTFQAVSNHTYTVQFVDSLALGPWIKLVDISAGSTSHLETVTDTLAATNRFYRIVTPAAP